MAAPQTRTIWRRLGWMALIWAVSVLALALVSQVIRFWLHA